MTGAALNHLEVLAAGQESAGRLGKFLVRFVEKLP
jgi:hypothetical protein